MGRALEVITGFVTAPGSTFTTWTMATGNSASVRFTGTAAPVYLLGAWAFNQVAGTLRIRSPKLHDQIQGLRFRIPASLTLRKYPSPPDPSFKQLLFPQDNLTLDQTGSGVAGQIESGSLLIEYEDIQGAGGRFIDFPTLMANGVNVVTAETSHTTGVAGGYSGQVAINSSFDTLKALTDYALVGYLVDTRGVSVRWQGIDTGNIGVGGPAEPSDESLTNGWFAGLARDFSLPLIPVFNATNKFGFLIDIATNQAGGTYIVTSILVELKPGAVPAGVSGGAAIGARP